MRTNSEIPGDVNVRWSDGKLQFVNKDGTVIFAVNPEGNRAYLRDARIDEAQVTEAHLARIHVPTGEILGSADDLNDAAFYAKHAKVDTGDLRSASASGAIVWHWKNREGVDAIVTRVVVDVTASGGTSGAFLHVGSAATPKTSAARSKDIIEDATANVVAVYDNLGSLGKATALKIAASDYVTAYISAEVAASLEGRCYICYVTPE